MNFGGNNIIWILVILFLFCGNGSTCGGGCGGGCGGIGNIFGGDSSILCILVVLFLFCGGGCGICEAK